MLIDMLMLDNNKLVFRRSHTYQVCHLIIRIERGQVGLLQRYSFIHGFDRLRWTISVATERETDRQSCRCRAVHIRT